MAQRKAAPGVRPCTRAHGARRSSHQRRTARTQISEKSARLRRRSPGRCGKPCDDRGKQQNRANRQCGQRIEQGTVVAITALFALVRQLRTVEAADGKSDQLQSMCRAHRFPQAARPGRRAVQQPAEGGCKHQQQHGGQRQASHQTLEVAGAHQGSNYTRTFFRHLARPAGLNGPFRSKNVPANKGLERLGRHSSSQGKKSAGKAIAGAARRQDYSPAKKNTATSRWPYLDP